MILGNDRVEVVWKRVIQCGGTMSCENRSDGYRNKAAIYESKCNKRTTDPILTRRCLSQRRKRQWMTSCHMTRFFLRSRKSIPCSFRTLIIFLESILELPGPPTTDWSIISESFLTMLLQDRIPL